jgi:elongation factor 1-beta
MSFPTVEALDKHLATKSYVTGYALSDDDKKAFAALKAFPARASTPNAYRWALHISALTGMQLAGGAPSSGSAPAPAAKAGGAKAKKADDEDMDLFGDDDDVNSDGENAEEAAATVARRQRMEAARKLKADADAKKGAVVKKEKPAEKSLIVLEVKPWEADTDLKMVWQEIIKKEQEGLRWGDSYKLEPVAYGIMKLVMTVTIEDAKVLLDDITEHIEGLEEWVQSCNVASMNKV